MQNTFDSEKSDLAGINLNDARQQFLHLEQGTEQGLTRPKIVELDREQESIIKEEEEAPVTYVKVRGHPLRGF